jgi:hypothetical protein
MHSRWNLCQFHKTTLLDLHGEGTAHAARTRCQLLIEMRTTTRLES